MTTFAQTNAAATPAAILQQLRAFRNPAGVLYIAAHPDDENTLLIAYLARGRDARTAYLSVTRGDGGQNVLGPEFDEKLGWARTQELLAARRLDGGRQFFTRAVDFGFSKNAEETLKIWNRQEILADIVRVIREFRPDVVITRFAPWPTGTHGHHTASAMLALEAFKIAGDTNAFPEQRLAPWQPKRIFWNGTGNATETNSIVRMEISGRDPVSGMTFGELAARSRGMHRTQGLGYFGGGDGPRTENFFLLAGEPATNDIFDGVDATWNRFPGGAAIGEQAGEIIAQFNPQNPAASVPALLKLRAPLMAQTKDPIVAEKRAQLDQILAACLGLEIQTTLPQAEVVPGQTLHLTHTAVVHSAVPVRWQAVKFPSLEQATDGAIPLQENETATRHSDVILFATTSLSQPYWLRARGTDGTFRVDEAELIGRPENPPAVPVEYVFEVGGQTLILPTEPVQIVTNAPPAQQRRRLAVIPPVWLAVNTDVALFAPGESRSVEIEVTAARAGASGNLYLSAPAGWRVTPDNQSFVLWLPGDRAKFSFTVTAPPQPATAELVALAEIRGVAFQNARVEINYPHLPRLLLQPPAAIKAVCLDLKVRSKNIGYLPGAGDSLAENLRQMGGTVTVLDETNWTAEKLRGFDAVVLGVRALNVRPGLVAWLPELFAYVEKGGTVVMQYNRPDNNLRDAKIAPFDLRLSGDRVTDETAPVTLLAPDHPALNTPNKITAADFAGWVQERGIYFPSQWDTHFTPLLACADPGETPKSGALLVAPYGQGWFVYTGLVFFRELPAGVPGAWRLFANLISLGR